jgi:hypothetical protein
VCVCLLRVLVAFALLLLGSCSALVDVKLRCKVAIATHAIVARDLLFGICIL